MASRASLNKVLLIGNLTRDPEMRYTPSGAAVCTFGLATNRYYTASDGEKKEETEFIKIVSWNKLAELCSQLLSKGRKVYVEGRLQTRGWETPDGQSRQTTEVVIDDMRILDSRRDFEGSYEERGTVEDLGSGVQPQPERLEEQKGASKGSVIEEKKETKAKKVTGASKKTQSKSTSQEEVEKTDGSDDVDLEDLPF